MLVAGVVVGLGLFLISWLSPVLAPLGLGLFLAALAAPLFTWLEARGRSAALALTLTIGIVLVVGAALIVLALSGAASLTDGLATYSDALEARYPDVVRRHGREPRGGASSAASSRRTSSSSVLRAVVGIVLEVGQTLVFAVIVAALLLLDGQRLSRLAAGGLGSREPGLPRGAGDRPGRGHLLRGPDPGQRGDRRSAARPDARPRRRRPAAVGRRRRSS